MPKQILLTAGHSDKDPGAVSKDGKRESDLAEILRNRTVAHLKQMGISALTDGEGTLNKPLTDVIAMAKANPGALFVEIHFNAAANPAARGVEALGYPIRRKLCEDLCQAIALRTGSPLRGTFGWKPPGSGQHHRLAVCEAGGVVLEVEFMSSIEGLKAYLIAENEIARDLAEVLAKHAGYDRGAPNDIKA